MEKLSAQDQEFVKEVALTDNATSAVKKAYKSITTDGSARAKGSQLLTNINIATAVQEVKKSLAERIPDDLLERVHLEGLVADKMVGETLEPDYAVRHKYLDSAYKIKGAYGEDATKPPVILMPVLVKFLNIKDDDTSSSGNPDRIP